MTNCYQSVNQAGDLNRENPYLSSFILYSFDADNYITMFHLSSFTKQSSSLLFCSLCSFIHNHHHHHSAPSSVRYIPNLFISRNYFISSRLCIQFILITAKTDSSDALVIGIFFADAARELEKKIRLTYILEVFRPNFRKFLISYLINHYFIISGFALSVFDHP